MRVNIMRTIGDYRLEPDLKNAGKSWPQVLAILIACLSSLNNRMLFSWPSPFTPKIVDTDIDETMASFFTTLPPVAMIVTCLASSSLNDCIRRKRTLLLVIITQAFSWTLPAVSRNVYAIYAARILSGVGDGIIFSSVPMYIGEVAPPKVRDTWGNALPLTYYTGEFFITVIGSYFSIQSVSLICIIVPILLLSTCFLLPETSLLQTHERR
nr:sugar transporter ERD6-like 6 [Leptinotarsa decemlineata]